MLYYNISSSVEAFSTNVEDNVDFPVVLPLHQAHSDLVRRLPEEMDDITGVDALISNARGLRIGVKTADCVPILLFDEENMAVGAVHSGWKGTVKNIVGATINRMGKEYGTRAEVLKAVIGPCIHIDGFEVGDEVYEKFAEMEVLHETGVPARRYVRGDGSGDFVRHNRAEHGGGLRCKGDGNWGENLGRWHIDLPEVVCIEMLQCGMKRENIVVRPECTWTMHDRFFSARRLGKEFDRQRIINCIMLGL